MTVPRNDDGGQARREAAALLGVDIDRMSPADGLRIDMISSLRLVIDAEQASVLSGGAADLGKLNVAVQSLIALLPGRELPAPKQDNHPDPRQVLWETYRQMRERGEVPDVGWQRHRIGELEAENERLRAQLVAGGLTPTLPDVADRQVGTSGNLKTVITPTEVVSPSEWRGETYAGPQRGPDDPPKPRVIEAKANPPAAPPVKPAWEAWLAAGGSVGGDRWANRNF